MFVSALHAKRPYCVYMHRGDYVHSGDAQLALPFLCAGLLFMFVFCERAGTVRFEMIRREREHGVDHEVERYTQAQSTTTTESLTRPGSTSASSSFSFS